MTFVYSLKDFDEEKRNVFMIIFVFGFFVHIEYESSIEEIKIK